MARTDHHWPVLIVAYFIIQTLSRTFIGSGLGLDEAEMVLTAQALEWGYGAQPPLYAWIQYGVFGLLGESIFALALVKNAFLCLTYLVLYRLLRGSYEKPSAGLATLSLFLLPQIAWESQRALSHSVLATAMVIITLAAFLRLSTHKDTRSYVLFGVIVALGALSKFNFLLLPIAMLASALSLPKTRSLVLNPRLLLSFAVSGAILALPIHWMINHQSRTLGSVHKFAITQTGSRFQAGLAGFLDLTAASISFLALLIAVLLILYLRYRQKHAVPAEQPVLFQIMLRTVIAALILTLIIVLFSGTTNVKGRWLQPVLVFAAPTCVLWVLPKLSALAWQRLLQAILVAALLVTVALPLHNRYGGLKGPSRRDTPFPGVAAAITEKYPGAAIVFAQNKWIGGNLLLINQNWRVETPGYSSEALRGTIILVWQSNNPQAPDYLLKELQTQKRTLLSIGPTTTVHLPYSAKPDLIFSASFASALVE